MQFSITYKLPISNATSAERGARWTLQPGVNRALRSIMQAYIGYIRFSHYIHIRDKL
jgi:hypothetical protein